MKELSIFLYLIAAIVISVLVLQKENRDAKAAKQAKQKKEAERVAREKEKAEADQRQREEARAEEERRRAEWDAKHGRLVIPVASVTFDNDDGTSRQKILKDLKVTGGDAYLNLEEYEYKGAPAIRVLVNDMCVGNVPKARVAEVAAVMDHLENGRIDIEKFQPEDEDEDGHRRGSSTIYRADLILVYSKTGPTVDTEKEKQP